MIYILVPIVFLQSMAIVRLMVNNRRIRNRHEQHIFELQHMIVKLAEVGERRAGQLQLSDDLRIKLENARREIDREMMNLQKDMASTLSKNNLIT